MDEIPETLLLFGRQRNFVPTDLVVGGKTVVKVCFGAAKGDQVRRVDRKDDAFVGCFVQLGKIVTFELVDKEDVAGRKIIKPVVNQKLPAARDRVIDLVGVVDMHLHGNIVVVQVGDRKGVSLFAVTDRLRAG